MEQAGALFGNNEGTVQRLGSNINSVLPFSVPELPWHAPGDGPSAQHAAELRVEPLICLLQPHKTREGCLEGRCSGSFSLASARARRQVRTCGFLVPFSTGCCMARDASEWGRNCCLCMFPFAYFPHVFIKSPGAVPAVWDVDVSTLMLPSCPGFLSFVPGIGFPPGCSIHSLCHQWPSGAGWSPGLQLATVQPHTAPRPARVIRLWFCHHEADPVKPASTSTSGFFFKWKFYFLCNKLT